MHAARQQERVIEPLGPADPGGARVGTGCGQAAMSLADVGCMRASRRMRRTSYDGGGRGRCELPRWMCYDKLLRGGVAITAAYTRCAAPQRDGILLYTRPWTYRRIPRRRLT